MNEQKKTILLSWSLFVATGLLVVAYFVLR